MVCSTVYVLTKWWLVVAVVVTVTVVMNKCTAKWCYVPFVDNNYACKVIYRLKSLL